MARNHPEIFQSLRLERSAGAPPLTATAAHSLLTWATSANVQQHVQTLVVTNSFMQAPSDQVMSDDITSESNMNFARQIGNGTRDCSPFFMHHSLSAASNNQPCSTQTAVVRGFCVSLVCLQSPCNGIAGFPDGRALSQGNISASGIMTLVFMLH